MCSSDLPKPDGVMSSARAKATGLEEAGEPVVWPDGLTAGSTKCAISQKEEEMKAAFSVAQPSFPLANMDAFRMSEDYTLPAVHTKEASYSTARPLPKVAGFKRKFIKGPAYESHKLKTRAPDSHGNTSHGNMRPRASSSAQELPRPVTHTFDDSDLSFAESESARSL